ENNGFEDEGEAPSVVQDSRTVENPHTLRAKLAALRRLIRLAMLATGWGRLFCIGAALVLADFALDRALRLPHGARLALLCLWGGLLLWQFLRQLAFPLLRPLPDEALALEVEERWAGPADLFATALQFAGGGAAGAASAALRSETVREAEGRAALMAPGRLVEWRRVRRGLLLGLAASALLALGVAGRPASAKLWFQRNVLLAPVDWPRRTALALLRAPQFVPRGESANIAVKATGVIPRTARLLLRGLRSGASRTVVMERTGGDTFEAELRGLDESAAFTVEAGDGVLEEHRLQVVDRPEVAAARMTVAPPSYIAEAPVELAWNAPTFEMPEGSRATILVEATKPLFAASCRIDVAPSPAPERTGDRSFAFTFGVDRDLECELTLTDTLGIGSAEPLRVGIRAVEDQAPEVKLTASGLSDMLVPQAWIPLTARATDDYGAEALWLDQWYEGPDGPEDYPRVELWQGAARSPVAAAQIVDLRGLDLPPTGRFVLSAGARDNCGVGGPNTAYSPALSFRLVTVHELLGALLLRQQDLRRDLEQQVQRQHDVARRFEALTSAGSPQDGELERLRKTQRALAQVLRLTGAGYADVLAQMLHNRLVAEPVYESRRRGIVQPLERLAAPEGGVLRAADAIGKARRGDVPPSAALDLMAGAVAEMKRVRARMMLLESYAAVVSSVEEISQEQRDLLGRTQQEQERILVELVGQ
ncbi:MAG: hypothetical protein KAX19_06155, partial [Candidatus Brocadiae bacterium]|nr:hypothetical protein [Candidatus Brocadiia bacterium]